MGTKVDFYSFGVETILKDKSKLTKFASAAAAAVAAKKNGFNFIMEYDVDGNIRVLAWDIKVLSRREALSLYLCDGDKRTIIRSSEADVWMISPIEGFSDMVFPFEAPIKSMEKVKFENLL